MQATATASFSDTAREFAFGDAEFDFLVQLTHQRTGIVLNQNKRDMVYARLTRRLRMLGLDSFEAYCTLLRSDAGDEEMGPLVNAITTNLTHFFREPHHFASLREQLQRGTPGRRFRVWSAGCSSGMEPYSMAMTLLDAVPNIAQWDARILATDIDSGMLETARAGFYPGEEFENIPPVCRRYVALQEERICIEQAPRELIRFRHLNLLEDWPMRGKFDVIFCRNVVIYFDTPTKRRLFKRYAEMLVPGGLLCIGHSESLPANVGGLVPAGRTTYRKP